MTDRTGNRQATAPPASGSPPAPLGAAAPPALMAPGTSGDASVLPATRTLTATAPVAHVGDTRVHWRRRLAYAVMIIYAVMMFTPFAWSVITSFKTQPDSVRL